MGGHESRLAEELEDGDQYGGVRRMWRRTILTECVIDQYGLSDILKELCSLERKCWSYQGACNFLVVRAKTLRLFFIT